MGSRDHEPHIKHLFGTTQKKLYERFKNKQKELNLVQRYFEKCKSWHVQINTLCNTCCRYHIDYHYGTFVYIHHDLYTNHVHDFSMIIPHNSLKNFIQSIMCNKAQWKTCYTKTCLDGTCSKCGGMTLLSQCIHESEDQFFWKIIVDMKISKHHL